MEKKFQISYQSIAIVLLCIGICSTIIGCGKKKDASVKEPLLIGAIPFGASKSEVLQIAESLGYNIEVSKYGNVDITNDVRALGITWDKMNLMIDSITGVKQIVLTRQYSETSPEIVNKHVNEVRRIFPGCEKETSLESISITNPLTGHTVSTKIDSGEIILINDSIAGYCGGVSYNRRNDVFMTLICEGHY